MWIVWVLGISARTAPRPPTGPAAPSTAARRSTGNGGGTPPRWTPGPRCRGYRGSNRSSAPARPSVESTHGQQFLVLRRAPRRVAGQERHRCRLFLPMGAHHGRSRAFVLQESLLGSGPAGSELPRSPLRSACFTVVPAEKSAMTDRNHAPRELWCFNTPSRRLPPVLMMQPAEDRATDEALGPGAP